MEKSDSESDTPPSEEEGPPEPPPSPPVDPVIDPVSEEDPVEEPPPPTRVEERRRDGVHVGGTCFLLSDVKGGSIGAMCKCHWNAGQKAECKTTLSLNLCGNDVNEGRLRMKRWLVLGLDIPFNSDTGKRDHMAHLPRSIVSGPSEAECDRIIEARTKGEATADRSLNRHQHYRCHHHQNI